MMTIVRLLAALFTSCVLLSACDSGPQQAEQATSSQAKQTSAALKQGAGIPMETDDIAGTVTSSNGPEAGVWVIAETDAFETRFSRIVATDDQGRYLIPDLPSADYRVWVRGYGLVDSAKTAASPGSRLDLTVRPASDQAAAAQVYPAAYWFAMLGLPSEEEVSFLDGGLNEYLSIIKNQDCVGCHQLGNEATRTIPAALGDFDNHQQAWSRRILSGQAGARMMRPMAEARGIPLKYFGDWTQRIAAGELPFAEPERPSGLERNVVVTVRDWMDPRHYVHDLSGTDRRNPTVNGYGKLYGAPELSTDFFPILDPVANTATSFKAPVRDGDTPSEAEDAVEAYSAYWGWELIWNSRAVGHNPMLDQDGRVWYTARIRAPQNPAFCREGSDHPSAQAFPTSRAGRQLAVYEPDTGEYTFVDTCYGTHHLQFAYDDDNTLWTSGGGDVVGWLNTRVFDETGDAEAAIGWSPFVLDTNGNGVRDNWVEPDQAVDPSMDKRIGGGYYAVMPNPADGSVWGSDNGYPGRLIRYDPETGLSEVYLPPKPGFGLRGADIDTNGVVWSSTASGHLAEFDRSKCAGPLNGPEATGNHCPEGWTFHDLPGPGFKDLPQYSVESPYYVWVDQHNTLGLGENVPMVTGNLFDGVHALVDGEFVTLRVPYPMGFYSKGFEGRIDDPDAGWKGRGLWVPYGGRTPWHLEGGKQKPIVLHIQVRSDPLAN